jgi:hypothetical protein
MMEQPNYHAHEVPEGAVIDFKFYREHVGKHRPGPKIEYEGKVIGFRPVDKTMLLIDHLLYGTNIKHRTLYVKPHCEESRKALEQVPEKIFRSLDGRIIRLLE